MFYVGGALTSSVIDPKLEAIFKSKSNNGRTVPVLIAFEQSIQTVIDRINSQTFPTLLAKRTALTETQIAFSEKAQKNLKAHLEEKNVPYKSYWINNKVVIPKADFSLVRSLSVKTSINGVARIEKVPDSVYPTLEEKSSKTPRFIGPQNHSNNKADFTAWHISRIRAPEAWAQGYTGRGVVVANIDTGVRYTHETLRDNWRNEYGWYDPNGWHRDYPYDDQGHGTSTMGTIAGKLGIGVAPDATWIACRRTDEFKCAQWIQCPTRSDGSGRDCSKAPDVVSNSWGFACGDCDPFKEVVASWKAAGIIPVFAIGNWGPNCSTAYISPANQGTVISVGGTDYNDRLASFSSRGPQPQKPRRAIPDITAPATDVYSALHTEDNLYAYNSGTSFSTPHVAGNYFVNVWILDKPFYC